MSFINNYNDAEKTLFMKIALKLADKAFKQGEIPIGALVVNQYGVIIGRGFNKVEKQKTQSAHAEIAAIKQASKKTGDWRLNGCWLYVTLEPCHMCIGLIKLSRLQGIVYGADSPLFGYSLDNQFNSRVYKNDKFFVIKGVLAQESEQLLKKFFAAQRHIKEIK